MGDHSTLTYPLDLEDIEDIFGYDEGPKSRSRQNLVVHKVKRFHKDGITYEANQNPELSSFLPGTHAVYVKTWGCTHNTSDGEYMAGQLAQQGYRITESRDEADVWILNSCAVKSPSEDHFRNEVNKGLESGKKVIVSGCVPQGRPNAEYIKGLSVIGVQQIDRVVEVVEETLKGNQVRLFGQKKVKMSETAAEESGGKLSRKAGGAPLAMPKIRRNPLVEILAINTGCLNQCTYCKTKHARGELGSYPMEEIVARAEQSFAEGVVEIWLTSEDTGAYGRDIGVTLPDLLWKLVKVIPDGCRLRVGMTNPPYILDHLDEMAKVLNHPRVYKFLHIPVQSGSDAVLAAMKREYNNTDFCRVVNILKQKVAGITIATDIICGFPTETDEDFLETVYLCKKYKFPSLYINQFYPRPGTPAAKMKRVTSAKDVKKRTKVLTDLFHSYEPYKKRLDATYTVLVTDVSHDHNYYVGHNDWYEQVLVPKNDNLMGKLVPVRIVSVSKFSMVGKVISDSLVASPTQVQPFKKGVVTCGKSVPREQKQDFFQRILYTISVMALGLAVIVRAYQILNFPTNPRQAATEVNL